MADAVSGVSGTSSPYASTTYSASSNDKNTLTITSYFKLLAAQLANQDMSNPMDNSEMMAQMTQMAMVQSMSAMTESIQTSTAVSTQTYAASLVGQEVTMVVVDKNGDATGVKYGIVESVNLTGSSPIIRLVGDSTDYPLSSMMGAGKLDNPYADKEDVTDSGAVDPDDEELEAGDIDSDDEELEAGDIDSDDEDLDSGAVDSDKSEGSGEITGSADSDKSEEKDEAAGSDASESAMII